MKKEKIEFKISQQGIRPNQTDPWAQTKQALGLVRSSLNKMGGAKNQNAYESAWGEYVDFIQQTWVRFNAEGRKISTKFAPWAGTGLVFVYGDDNRLKSVSQRPTPPGSDILLASYRHNAHGQRVSKDDGGEVIYFSYDQYGNLIGESDGSGNPVHEYIYVDGQLLAMTTGQQTSGQGGTEIVLDNDSPESSFTGSWSLKTNSNESYGSSYRVSGRNPGTYRWTPSLGAGQYEVFAWWVSKSNFTSQAPYTISHNATTAVVTVDQTDTGGQWVSLGVYDFNGGGSEYVELSSANGKVSADAVRFVDQATGQTEAVFSYIHTDHLGSPQVLTDQNGTVVWKANYSPFGEVTITNNTVSMPIRFPGQYYDAETGLHYNYFRNYDPSTGRYIQSDPIGLEGGLNTYAYAANNPVGLIDPLGLAYSPAGEHDVSRFESGLAGGKEPNACGCADKFGLETLFAGSLVLGGQPNLPKAFTPKNATPGTSPISSKLSEMFPKKLSSNVWAPTTKNPGARTNVVGRIAGRWAPIIGWGMLSYDYYQYLSCISECEENECKN